MIKLKKLSIKPVLSYCKRAKIELIIIAAVLFVDLLTKFLISHYMELDTSVTLIDNFLSFFYTKNTAAAFSFDFGLTKVFGEEGVRIFFIVLMSVVTVGFIVVMVIGQKNHRLYRISFALIIAGALGNLYDRIFHHGVRDFIRFEYFGKEIMGSKYFAIFNIADSSLVIGVGMFIVYFLFFFNKDEKAKEARRQALKSAQNAQVSSAASLGAPSTENAHLSSVNNTENTVAEGEKNE